MDIAMALRLQVPVNPLSCPLEIIALDGRSIAPGSVTEITNPLTVSVSHHLESMGFYLISSPELPLIQGHPWLTRHNPHIKWLSWEVLSWLSLCQNSFLKSPRIIPEDIKSIDLSRVPSEYHHLQSVFCKERATVLPPPTDLMIGQSSCCLVHALLEDAPFPYPRLSRKLWKLISTSLLLLGSLDHPHHLLELGFSLLKRRMVGSDPALIIELSIGSLFAIVTNSHSWLLLFI